MKDQLQRSAVSIPSNIAEGDELQSQKQSIKHFYIAKGSCAELFTQLLISAKIGYIQEEQFLMLSSKCKKISAQLQSLINVRSKSINR